MRREKISPNLEGLTMGRYGPRAWAQGEADPPTSEIHARIRPDQSHLLATSAGTAVVSAPTPGGSASRVS